jgi:hypothetical protein
VTVRLLVELGWKLGGVMAKQRFAVRAMVLAAVRENRECIAAVMGWVDGVEKQNTRVIEKCGEE